MSPADIPVSPSFEGEPVISLSRGVRFKIVLITLLVLIFTMSVSSVLMNRLFVKTYQDALLLEGTGTARNLRIQLERILGFEIKLDAIVGFVLQYEEAVAKKTAGLCSCC